MKRDRSFRFFRPFLIVLLDCGVFVMNAPSQISLSRCVLAQGAIEASASGYRVKGTIGQAVIGRLGNGGSAGFLGFWYHSGNTVVSIGRDDPITDTQLGILDVYPQPARTKITVLYRSTVNAVLLWSLQDLLGRQRLSGSYPSDAPDIRQLIISPGDLPAGMYFLRLEARTHTATQRILLLR